MNKCFLGFNIFFILFNETHIIIIYNKNRFMGNYPYLGVKTFEDETQYVVLFTEQDYGVVVMNNTSNENIKFGLISSFDENEFDFLDKEQCVIINN